MKSIRKIGADHDDTLKLIAVGDVLMGVEVERLDGSKQERIRKDPNSACAAVKHIVKNADIAFFNLEAPLSNRGKRAIGRMITWWSSPDMVKGLKSAGFTLANLANNHIMNYGKETLIDTIDILNKHDIAHIGAGMDISEARKPLILERKNTRLAFLGYSTSENQPYGYAARENKPGILALKISPLYDPPHVNEESLEMLIEGINDVRPKADIAVCSCHFSFGIGIGGSRTMATHQRAIAHAAIDAGADLFLGHGPHLLQGIEVYNGKVIAYNLGQFVVDRDVSADEKMTMILKCEIATKQIRRVSFLPVLINEKGNPQPLSPNDEHCQRIQQLIKKLSAKLGTALSFDGAEGVVLLTAQ